MADNDRSRLVGDDTHVIQKRCCSEKCLIISCIVLSALAIALGVSILFVFAAVFSQELKQLLPIYNGSQSFSAWQSAPYPIYMQFWVFNVTNPAEVVEGGKPALAQLGPFTYQEKRHKVDIRFHENKPLVTYREIRTFHFVSEMSAYNEDEMLTFINLPIVVVAEMLKRYPNFLKTVLAEFLKYEDKGLYIQRSFKDILWGYNDTGLFMLSKLAKIFGVKIDPVVGLFINKNNSDDGLYTVYTGQSDLQRIAQVHRWNNSNKLHYWTSSSANALVGTDGSLFHSSLSQSDRLYIFSTDICRSIYVEFKDTTNIKGISAYQFQAPASVFANASINPDNAGFCLPDASGCLDSGALNLSTCQPGVPAIASQPNFYQAADKYINAVEGLRPSEECATTIAVEPYTGVVMQANKKLQVNLVVEPVDGFKVTEKIRSLFLPLMWINESTTVDDDSASQFKSQVLQPITIAAVCQWALIAVGVFLLVSVISYVAVKNVLRQRDTSEPPLGSIQNHGSDEQRESNEVHVNDDIS